MYLSLTICDISLKFIIYSCYLSIDTSCIWIVPIIFVLIKLLFDKMFWFIYSATCSKVTCLSILPVQCSPFIMLCLGSVGMDHVISELCCKRTITKEL